MKFFYLLGMIPLVMSGMTACGNDDNPDWNNPDAPQVSKGAFILYQGNYTDKMEGSLSVIDYAGNSIAHNVFKTANSRSLGSTPQCGIVYGNKIYIGMFESNTIEIIDRNSFKSIRQISLENSSSGRQPRSMVAKEGKVYISMYNGYISRLDTLSLDIDRAVKVGDNPEEIAIHGNNIYVPNSEGMNSLVGKEYGKTASVVSLNPFQEIKRFEVPQNPGKFLTNGEDLYLICNGDYGSEKPALYRISSDLKYEKIAYATMGAIKDHTIYLINYPWGNPIPDPTFSKYDIISGKLTEFKVEGIPAPTGIGVDPKYGDIIITSYVMENGWWQDSLPGMVFLFRADGSLAEKFAGGLGATSIFFNME